MSPRRYDKDMESQKEIIIEEKTEAISNDMTTEKVDNMMYLRISQIPDKIETGDTREIMVEVLGEPDEIRRLEKNIGYEEVVYLDTEYGEELVIVLESDVITDIFISGF